MRRVLAHLLAAVLCVPIWTFAQTISGIVSPPTNGLYVTTYGGAQGTAFSYTDGTMTSGTSAFQSNSATFTPAMVGNTISLAGCQAISGTVYPYKDMTITGWTDSHHVTLSSTCANTLPFLRAWRASVSNPGTGYVIGDSVCVNGGTYTTQACITVAAITVVSATVNAQGSGFGSTSSCFLKVAGGVNGLNASILVEIGRAHV